MTIYRGLVTRVDALGAYVEVPKLGLGVEYGPCEIYSPAIALSSVDSEPYTQPSSDLGTDETSSTWRTHDHPDFGSGGSSGLTLAQHRHQVLTGAPGVKPGVAVLVSDVAGVKDDLVVLAVLR